MPKNIRTKPLPSLPRSNQLIHSLDCTLRIPSPPLWPDLTIQNLPYRHDSKRMRHYRTCDTCHSCDHSFLAIAEIVVGFGRFDLVIDYGVD